MKINYFDCEFNDYDSDVNGEGEHWYGCSHSDGYQCVLDNKYGGRKADCKLLDTDKLPEAEHIIKSVKPLIKFLYDNALSARDNYEGKYFMDSFQFEILEDTESILKKIDKFLDGKDDN